MAENNNTITYNQLKLEDLPPELLSMITEEYVHPITSDQSLWGLNASNRFFYNHYSASFFQTYKSEKYFQEAHKHYLQGLLAIRLDKIHFHFQELQTLKKFPNDPIACLYLAICYFQGWGNFPRNIKLAMQYATRHDFLYTELEKSISKNQTSDKYADIRHLLDCRHLILSSRKNYSIYYQSYPYLGELAFVAGKEEKNKNNTKSLEFLYISLLYKCKHANSNFIEAYLFFLDLFPHDKWVTLFKKNIKNILLNMSMLYTKNFPYSTLNFKASKETTAFLDTITACKLYRQNNKEKRLSQELIEDFKIGLRSILPMKWYAYMQGFISTSFIRNLCIHANPIAILKKDKAGLAMWLSNCYSEEIIHNHTVFERQFFFFKLSTRAASFNNIKSLVSYVLSDRRFLGIKFQSISYPTLIKYLGILYIGNQRGFETLPVPIIIWRYTVLAFNEKKLSSVTEVFKHIIKKYNGIAARISALLLWLITHYGSVQISKIGCINNFYPDIEYANSLFIHMVKKWDISLIIQDLAALKEEKFILPEIYQKAGEYLLNFEAEHIDKKTVGLKIGL